MTDETKTIACVLFPGVDPLDLIGPMQPLGFLGHVLPGWRTVAVGEQLTAYETDGGPLRLTPSHTFAEVPAPDVLVVPGASTPLFRAMSDRVLTDYVRSAAEHAQIVASVCSGSLLLAAAGLLDGRKATTHWTAFDLLAEFGVHPVRERWVEDGRFVTAAGQSAGIDMGLHLVERLGGTDIARLTQYAMEYDPEPPLGRLDWPQAPYEFFDPFVREWITDGLADNPALAASLLARARAGQASRQNTTR
ncbi:DJ-1/PfpI family protein [Nocardia brasiliensis]